MKNIKPKNTGTKRLFNNTVLEKLTRTHIAVPLVIFFLYAAGLLYWSIAHTSLSAGLIAGTFFIGIFAFTWIEYMVHRHVFHMFAKSDKHAQLRYTMHGVHHEFPKDKGRLAMPPILSLTLSTSLLILLRTVLGDLVFSFLPGFLIGYAAYLSIHYMVHRFQPPKNFMRVLWIHHSFHHYKNEEKAFGVSSPLWDYIYGTMANNFKAYENEK